MNIQQITDLSTVPDDFGDKLLTALLLIASSSDELSQNTKLMVSKVKYQIDGRRGSPFEVLKAVQEKFDWVLVTGEEEMRHFFNEGTYQKNQPRETLLAAIFGFFLNIPYVEVDHACEICKIATHLGMDQSSTFIVLERVLNLEPHPQNGLKEKMLKSSPIVFKCDG